MNAELLRFADSPFGAFGWLDLFNDAGERVARFCAAEDDWLNNAPGKSCIPAGSYTCRRGRFPRMGETFEITNVPGRSAILIHSGNTEEDVQGCVLVGEAFGALDVKDEDDPSHTIAHKWAVVRSKVALQRFLGLVAGLQTFPLEIRWALPGEWR